MYAEACAGLQGMTGFRVKRRKESLGDVLYWKAGRIAGSLYRIYFMALPETEEDYEKSRRFYISGDSAAQTIAQLAGGTFLVSLLLSAGFSDAETGVVTSIASLAAVFQLFTMQRINRLRKRKLFVCFLCAAEAASRPSVFSSLSPVQQEDWNRVCFLAGYFLAQVWSQIATPATQDWIASLVPMKERGSYFSRKGRCGRLRHGYADAGHGRRDGCLFRTKAASGLFHQRQSDPVSRLLNFGAFSCMKEPRMGETTPEGREIHCRPSRKGSDKEQFRRKSQKEKPEYPQFTEG